MSMNNMGTMAIRDLIAGMRAETKKMDGGDVIKILLFNTLAARFEQQEDYIDKLEDVIATHADPTGSSEEDHATIMKSYYRWEDRQ